MKVVVEHILETETDQKVNKNKPRSSGKFSFQKIIASYKPVPNLPKFISNKIFLTQLRSKNSSVYRIGAEESNTRLSN
jgi:hypothetical protein